MNDWTCSECGKGRPEVTRAGANLRCTGCQKIYNNKKLQEHRARARANPQEVVPTGTKWDTELSRRWLSQ